MPCNDTDFPHTGCSVCTTQYSMMYALESYLLSLFTVWDHWKNQCCVRMSWPKLLLFHRTNCGVVVQQKTTEGHYFYFAFPSWKDPGILFSPRHSKLLAKLIFSIQNFFITLHVSIKIHSEPSVEAIKTKDFFHKDSENSTSVTIFGMWEIFRRLEKKDGEKTWFAGDSVHHKERKKKSSYHEASWGGIDKS